MIFITLSGNCFMKLNYSVTERDCLHLSSYFLMRSGWSCFGVWMIRIIGTPLVVGAMYALMPLGQIFFEIPPNLSDLWNLPSDSEWARWLVSIGAGLAWLVAACGKWRKLMSGKARKLMKEKSYDRFIGRHRLEIKESGLIEYFNGRVLRVSWSEVVKIISDEPLVYISLSSSEAIIIPLRLGQNDMKFSTREYDKVIGTLKAATGLQVIYSARQVGLSP